MQQYLPMIAYFGGLALIMYFLLIRPQKTRDRKAREMLSALKVGDEVITIGGINGKIINILDNEITIETSVEKTQIVIQKWGIKEVVTPT